MTKQEEMYGKWRKFFNYMTNLCGMSYSQIYYQLYKAGVYNALQFDEERLKIARSNCIRKYNDLHPDNQILDF